MSSVDDSLEVFRFYVDGFVQYSLLLVASTVGVFSPLLVVVSPHVGGFFLDMLVFVYLVFSVASGYCLSRLVGILALMIKAMPEEMRKIHFSLVGTDFLSVGRHKSIRDWASKKWVQVASGIIPVLVYLVLLFSALAQLAQ